MVGRKLEFSDRWMFNRVMCDEGILRVAHAWAPNPPSIYADIVLPVTTPWERAGRISADGGRDTITLAQPVCDPLYEARSDQDVVRGLAPLCVYKEKAMGYEATFSNFEKGEKGEYPFQVFCLKTLRDVASTMDNVPQLRETIKNPVIMAAADAKELGIQTGDAVKVTSPTGVIVRKVSVTSRQMPGTLVVPWGGWYEYDEAAQADIGGASNTLTGGVVTGQGTSGYNSVIAKVEKYTGSIVDDVEKAPVVFFEEDGE